MYIPAPRYDVIKPLLVLVLSLLLMSPGIKATTMPDPSCAALAHPRAAEGMLPVEADAGIPSH